MLNEERPLLAKRWPEMAAKVQKRLLGEGKITKEMIESYVDAYAGIYGDDTDAYVGEIVEEIVADTYAGMNRTDYGTNQLRADVKMEVGQWQKKSGSARAPPAKYSMVGRGENGLKTYKSDFGSDMTVEEKKTYMYRLITDVWAKKPLQLTILQDGKERQITARFDGEENGERFAGKMAYGNRRGNRTERLITLNLANDIWEIANESRYENSKGEFKQTRMHESSERWHYFVNAINYVDDAQPGRNGVYDFNLDVMERDDGDFVYTFSLKKRRTDAPRTFTAGVDGQNAADADSSKNSISKTGETVKGKMSAQDGRYRDLMGEKAAQYTKGKLCAYRKIKKSLSKTGEGFLYRCTIIPITPFTKTMRSDKDTSGTPETIRTSDPSLRSTAYHFVNCSYHIFPCCFFANCAAWRQVNLHKFP